MRAGFARAYGAVGPRRAPRRWHGHPARHRPGAAAEEASRRLARTINLGLDLGAPEERGWTVEVSDQHLERCFALYDGDQGRWHPELLDALIGRHA
jgi:hypothetical protein